jgi:hypothetical protein
MDAFDHADTPKHIVMEDLQEQGRELGLRVAFQVFAAELTERDPRDGLSIRLTDFRSATREFDLQLLLTEPGEHGITGWLIHRTSVLSPRDGRLWMEEYGALSSTTRSRIPTARSHVSRRLLTV